MNSCAREPKCNVSVRLCQTRSLNLIPSFHGIGRDEFNLSSWLVKANTSLLFLLTNSFPRVSMVHVMAVAHMFLIFLIKYNACVFRPGIFVAELSGGDA